MMFQSEERRKSIKSNQLWDGAGKSNVLPDIRIPSATQVLYQLPEALKLYETCIDDHGVKLNAGVGPGSA